MNQLKNTLMRTSLLIIVLFVLQGCNAQEKENPKYLIGNYDLEQIRFDENIDSLFSKIDHLILPHKYDSIIGYEYRIDTNYRDSVNAYFIDTNFRDKAPQFFTDTNRKFGAISINISRKESFEKELELLSNKYKGYEVKLKENPYYLEANVVSYQWETPEKIISITAFTKLVNEDYFASLTMVRRDIDFDKFPINFMINMSEICLDNSCKE